MFRNTSEGTPWWLSSGIYILQKTQDQPLIWEDIYTTEQLGPCASATEAGGYAAAEPRLSCS